MDVIDEAQRRTEHFHKLVMQNRLFDLAPLPPSKTNSKGHALCVDCDIEIEARRKAIPNAQRCVECQTDFDKMERR